MKKVAVFGTFDIFHPGHVSFLEQAKKQSDYLLVIVARDKNSAKIKGREPRNSEEKRAQRIRKSNLANKVVLGSKTNNYFRTLRTHKINLILLGYDQKPTKTQLKKSLKRHRLANVEIKRARAYNPHKFKSSKLG